MIFELSDHLLIRWRFCIGELYKMEYDENFLYSYSSRVKDNYEALKDSEFDVTMLLCSFVSIVAIIDDNIREELFMDAKIPDYINPKPNIPKNGETEILAFYRHLRNSLCHLKIDNQRVKSDGKKDILSVKLEDIWKHNEKGRIIKDKVFECTLTVTELKELFYEVVAIIHEKTKKQED